MALLNHVGCYVCVQVMNVMIFNAVGEWPEYFGDLQVSASLEGCSGEVPLIFALSIGHIDRVLKVEENGSNCLRHV